MAKSISVEDSTAIKSLHTFWLYFVPGKDGLQNWFCNNHSHIALLTLDFDFMSHWLMFDPQPNRLNFEIFPFKGSFKGLPQCLIGPNNAVACVRLTVRLDQIKHTKYRWWHSLLPRCVSCTSMIEYLIGIKTRSFTPWGLFKYLKKHEKKPPKPIDSIEFIKIDNIQAESHKQKKRKQKRNKLWVAFYPIKKNRVKLKRKKAKN